MLFAVLFDAEEKIIAVAPACEEQPYGRRYWSEIYPVKLSLHSGNHTGYIEVTSQNLIERIERIPFDDSQLELCAAELERIALETRQPVHRKAA